MTSITPRASRRTLARRTFMGLTATAAIAFTAACGSGSPSGGAGEQSGSGAAAEGELQTVNVGVIPIVDTAAIWLGEDEGIFEKHGLDLELQTASGGAAIVPGVVSGDYDFAFSNLVSIMVAQDRGIDLQVVANGVTAADGDEDFGAVMVKDDSPIQSAKDLEGKTVSVNNLSNIGDVTIKNAIKADGGDPASVEFMEIGFPDAPAALESGQVDAAWVLEPFLTSVLDQGGRVVAYNHTAMDADLDIAAYFTSGQTAQEDPELVEKFTDAMNESLEFAQENPDRVREIVGTYTQIDEETRAKMIMPRFTPGFSVEADQKLADAAAEYGVVSTAPDMSEMLP